MWSGDLGPPVESVEIQDVDIAEASIGIAASYYIYIISETVHGEAVPLSGRLAVSASLIPDHAVEVKKVEFI